jgi:NAD(P)-dependent dehydrogenase (short-subunit alcohol dehydrogenase family)
MRLKTSIRTHEERVALVTGAGQGIGQAIALALAERGAVVIATDLTPPHETAEKVGPAAKALPLDATKEEDWHTVLVRSRDLGEVDIVVNNAGYFPNRSIDDLDLQTWRKTFATKLGLSLFEREVLFANHEEKETGPLRRHIVKYGWLADSRHEPLHRYCSGSVGNGEGVPPLS